MAYSIVVKDLSKRYMIGGLYAKNTLRETMVNLVKHPVRWGGEK